MSLPSGEPALAGWRDTGDSERADRRRRRRVRAAVLGKLIVGCGYLGRRVAGGDAAVFDRNVAFDAVNSFGACNDEPPPR